MTEQNVNILQRNNFKQVGITWIGKIKNLFWEVTDIQDAENKLGIIISISANENKSKIFEELDSFQKKEVISDYSFENNLIKIIYIENETTNLEEFLKTISSTLEEIGAVCKCSCCDNTQNLNYYSSGYKYLLLCDSCAEKTLEQAEKEKNSSGHYFKGFIFSLVGALIGSILWIILGAVGFIASFAGVAISFCAFKGFEKAKAKLTKKGIVINVIAIIIAFLFAQYAGLYIMFKKEVAEATIRVFLILTPILFRDMEFVKSLIPDFLIGILFLFLGSSSTIKQNLNQAKLNDEFKIEKVSFEE